MLKLAADENFNNIILRGILRRDPGLDIIRIQDSEIAGADDEVLLEWIAQENRVLLTHDVNTITGFAYERVRQGLAMPGVFQVDDSVSMSTIIEDILLLALGSLEGEWENQVRYIPLR